MSLKISMTHVMMILLAGVLLWATPGYTVPIPTGELIINGGFDTDLSGWTRSSITSVNRRLSNDPINLSGGNAGFNSFFTSPFVVLGDNSGVIGGTTAATSPASGTFSISQAFTLPELWGGVAIESYDLFVRFWVVFDGQDSITDNFTQKDIFSASVSGITLFNVNSSPFPSGAPSTASPNAQFEFGKNVGHYYQLPELMPGDYVLTFTLTETAATSTNNFTDTAAGIDNVSIMGFANPAPVPEPATLLLLGGGLAALALFGRRAGMK